MDSIVAFQAIDPGSTPGQRRSWFFSYRVIWFPNNYDAGNIFGSVAEWSKALVCGSSDGVG